MKQLIPQSLRATWRRIIRDPLMNKYERSKYKSRPILTSDRGNETIAKMIRQNNPAAIGKIGSEELQALVFYKKTLQGYQNHPKFMDSANRLYVGPGVFPVNESVFNKFSSYFLKVLSDMDHLGVWFNFGEAQVVNEHAPKAILSDFRSLEPYYHANPWSQELENKKVLILHPFTDSIEQQYQKRKYIWLDRPSLLPDFSLDTIKIPLHAVLVKPQAQDWFESLATLKHQMSQKEFDVAIIGAGAWSLPLALHAKNLGKIGIHLGGATQIFFGIKGKRWDHKKTISKFYNDAWGSPSSLETPPTSNTVEQGCYWY